MLSRSRSRSPPRLSLILRLSSVLPTLIAIVVLVCCSCPSYVYVSGTGTVSTSMNPAPLRMYGSINPEHNQTLPNLDSNGKAIHYALNNLPVQEAGQITVFKALFAVNQDLAGSNLPHNLQFHVVRPTTTADEMSLSRDVTYVRTIDLTNVVSGVEIDLSSYQVSVQVGDLIALSVPNNAVFLRVGANDQGLDLSYAHMIVPDNFATSGAGTFVVVDSVTKPRLQLCTTYGALGTAGGQVLYNYWFFNEREIQPFNRDMHEFTVGLQHAGTIELALAIKVNGHWVSDPTSSRSFPNVQPGVPVTVSPAFVIPAGSIVGITADNQANLQTNNCANGQSTALMWWQYWNQGAPLPLTATSLTQTAGWCDVRFTFTAAASVKGDPQFAGFQGQSYQFHGLADEHFNLISSSQLQLNSHFVYLSSGSCTYNDTTCFQHPGTYLDVLGFSIPAVTGAADGDVRIRMVAGSHEDGLRVWMSQSGSDVETEIIVGKHKHGLTWKMDGEGNKATLTYNKFGQVNIRTPMFDITVVNSDFFFNLQLALLDREMLRIGQAKHTITDHETCQHDKHGHAQVVNVDADHDAQDVHAAHDHGLVEAALMKKYHVSYPVHGLIGQTWRNVLVCGKEWMGGVQDYVTSGIFAADYYYNFYNNNNNSTRHA